MAVGMINSVVTSWLADPDYPVESGLVEATEFALGVLAPRGRHASIPRRPHSDAEVAQRQNPSNTVGAR